eukprot:g51538.t1
MGARGDLNRLRKTASQWTDKEDEIMIDYVSILLEDSNNKDKWGRSRFKIGIWEKVSRTLYDGDKTAKQCRERWNRYLDPRFRRPQAYPFSAPEDSYIMQEYNMVGPRWAEIGEPISRSGAIVKNRFDVLRNRMFYQGIGYLHAPPVDVGHARMAARLRQQPQLRTPDSGSSRRTATARGPSSNQCQQLFPDEALALDGKTEGKIAVDNDLKFEATFPAERKVTPVRLVLSAVSGQWEAEEPPQKMQGFAERVASKKITCASSAWTTGDDNDHSQQDMSVYVNWAVSDATRGLTLQSSSSTTSDIASILDGRADMTIDAASGFNSLKGLPLANYSVLNGNHTESDSKMASVAAEPTVTARDHAYGQLNLAPEAEHTMNGQLEINDFIRTAAASSTGTSDQLDLSALPPSPHPAAFFADDGDNIIDMSSFPLLSPVQGYRPFAASEAINASDIDNVYDESLYSLEF